jgi:hypothetical protein
VRLDNIKIAGRFIMELSLEQASNLAELIGVALVIVSIFYLTVQVRQNTKATRIQTVHDLSAMYIEAQSSLAQNAELMALYQRGQFDYESLDPLEKGRFGVESAALMRVFSDLHFQYINGTLDHDEWLGFKAVVDDLFTYSGFQTVWGLRKYHYSTAFQQYIKSILESGDKLSVNLYPDPKAEAPGEGVALGQSV